MTFSSEAGPRTSEQGEGGAAGLFAFTAMAACFRVRDVIWPPEAALRKLGVGPGHTVLDFGCGPGGYSVAAARLVGTEGRVYAVDINPRAVRWVSRAAKRRRLERVVPTVASHPGGLPSRAMDFAILHDVLHELGDVETVVRGMLRVLKPGGVFAVSDHHLREEDIVATVTATGSFGLKGHVRGFCRFEVQPACR